MCTKIINQGSLRVANSNSFQRDEENNDAKLIPSRKLNGQRHDRVQTKSQEMQPRTAVPELKNSMFG